MKKSFKKSAKQRYNFVAEDLRILQQKVTKQSVYAKARINQGRRPKHPKRFLEYVDAY